MTVARPLAFLALSLGALSACSHGLSRPERNPASNDLHPVDLAGARIEVIHGYGVQRDQIYLPVSTDDGQTYRMETESYSETVGVKAYELRVRSAEEMLRRKNFSEAEYRDLLRAARGLAAGSVSALRIFEQGAGRPEHAGLSDLNPGEHTTSTLLLSAGQVPAAYDVDLNITKTRNVEVAFMKQTRFADFAARIDRSKEKHIFEFIAGSNLVGKGRFRFLFGQLILMAAQQVLDQGGKLEDAYVYLHTTRIENRNRFAGSPPDGKVGDGYNFADVTDFGEGHSILRRSLRELINDFLPHRYFSATRDQVERLGIDPASAIELLHAIEDIEPRTLDVFRTDGERSRAATEDMSTFGRGTYTRDPSRFPQLEVRLHDRGYLTDARAEGLARKYRAPVDVVLGLIRKHRGAAPLEVSGHKTDKSNPTVEIELHGDLTLENVTLDFESLKRVYLDDLTAAYVGLGHNSGQAIHLANQAAERTEWRIYVDPREVRHLRKFSQLLQDAGFKRGADPFAYSASGQAALAPVRRAERPMHPRLNTTRSKRHFDLKAR